MEADGDPTPTDAAEDTPELTPEQEALLRRYTHGFGDQDENGIDLSSLRRNLALTPSQRLNRLQQAVNTLPMPRKPDTSARASD